MGSVWRGRVRSRAGRDGGASETVDGCRWNPASCSCRDTPAEVVNYVVTWRHVSASCRLTANEEQSCWIVLVWR